MTLKNKAKLKIFQDFERKIPLFLSSMKVFLSRAAAFLALILTRQLGEVHKCKKPTENKKKY